MGEKRGTCTFMVTNQKGGHQLKDPGVNGWIILKRIFEKWDERGMDWIDLAQDRDRWRAVVNVVMNFWLPYNAGNFLTS
jgi:hypothetical protein